MLARITVIPHQFRSTHRLSIPVAVSDVSTPVRSIHLNDNNNKKHLHRHQRHLSLSIRIQWRDTRGMLNDPVFKLLPRKTSSRDPVLGAEGALVDSTSFWREGCVALLLRRTEKDWNIKLLPRKISSRDPEQVLWWIPRRFGGRDHVWHSCWGEQKKIGRTKHCSTKNQSHNQKMGNSGSSSGKFDTSGKITINLSDTRQECIHQAYTAGANKSTNQGGNGGIVTPSLATRSYYSRIMPAHQAWQRWLLVLGIGAFILAWDSTNTDNQFCAIFTQDAHLILLHQQVASSSKFVYKWLNWW